MVWLASSLDKWVRGARVQKVRRRDQFCIVLQCHRPSQPFELVISLNPATARLSVNTLKYPTVPANDTFAAWLKSNLRGHRLTSVRCDSKQKLMVLESTTVRLMIELFGHQPRMLGLDADGNIRCCAPSKLRRDLRMGEPYMPPKFDALPVVNAEQRFPDVDTMERTALALEGDLRLQQEELHRMNLIRRARKQFSRLEKKLRADREGLGIPEHWQKLGELLKGEAWRLSRGMESIVVTDYYDPEMPTLEITLDPRLTGPENIEYYFKRYRRGVSGAGRVDERLKSVTEKLEKLVKLEQSTISGDELVHALRTMGMRPSQTTKGSTQKVVVERKPYHEFRSANSERIFVGRGGRDNHQTTFAVGKGNDHWLHVKDAAGAHVLIPVVKGRPPSESTILDAVALAIHYSKLRGEPDALVTHTQRKYVRPIPGGAFGRVIVQSEKVRQGFDVDKRIARLFSDREKRG